MQQKMLCRDSWSFHLLEGNIRQQKILCTLRTAFFLQPCPTFKWTQIDRTRICVLGSVCSRSGNCGGPSITNKKHKQPVTAQREEDKEIWPHKSFWVVRQIGGHTIHLYAHALKALSNKVLPNKSCSEMLCLQNSGTHSFILALS